jgi:transposase
MLLVYDERLHQVRRQLLDRARHTRGAAELTARLYGVGPVTGLALTCWLGGAGRFSSSRKAVRFAGLDITVHSSYAEDDVKPGNPAPALSGLGLLMSSPA